MGKTIIRQITDCIERIFEIGGISLSKKIIVYPCGDIGIQAINILNNVYSIKPAYMIDNHKCKYTKDIHEISFLNDINTEDYVLFLTSINSHIYKELKDSISMYFNQEQIIELECMTLPPPKPYAQPVCGKYSFGPLCTNYYVESIGSFCSFAIGSGAVGNHPTSTLTTHPFLYHHGSNVLADGSIEKSYDDFADCPWYFPGVNPHEMHFKNRRSRIGNDVWLGCNVIITNGAYIGNGVIAAAGAVITKDVPDYAIVAGVPARIIKYRYNPEQIDALNKIAWWDWSDDEIRERYDDFYLPIDEFIKKYI